MVVCMELCTKLEMHGVNFSQLKVTNQLKIYYKMMTIYGNTLTEDHYSKWLHMFKNGVQ